MESYLNQVASANARLDKVAAWLNAYTGDGQFYQSLRGQLQRKGFLSDKQMACVEKAIEWDEGRTARTFGEVQTPLESTLKVGTILITGKFFARQVAFQAGLARPHHAFEVMRVHRETAKAWQVDLRLAAQRTTHCAICGAWLSNPESVSLGIGPICAEKVGVSKAPVPLDQLAKELETTATVTTWFPKSAVKEHILCP